MTKHLRDIVENNTPLWKENLEDDIMFINTFFKLHTDMGYIYHYILKKC